MLYFFGFHSKRQTYRKVGAQSHRPSSVTEGSWAAEGGKDYF